MNHSYIHHKKTIFARGSSNTTNSNGQYGIKIGGGSNNKLINNTISFNANNGIYLDGGTFSDTLTGNFVTYNSGSGIVLWGAGNNNAITDNTMTNNGYALPEGYIRFGIYILGSNSNTITGNNISSNIGYGIKISNSSTSNIFTNNTVSLNSQYGIQVTASTGNTIYHNNILNNGSAQASDDDPANNDWHDPGLLEGNYWSDYSGVDDGSGTAKHAIAGDGIGDTNLPHPAVDYDSYPFTVTNGWEAPLTPQNLIATLGNQQVSLIWDANNESDLAKYRIYCATSSPATTLIDSVVGVLPDTVFTNTGLTNGQTYYYRITAVDSAGNESGYSDEAFATPVETGTMTDIDGNVYQTVKIGDKWWMAENLKTIHYRNGDGITKLPNNTVWSTTSEGAYCNYDNTDSNADIYGSLYNWYAVNDSRNIAPEGWHVPADAEWQILVDYLGGQAVAGGKMRETGTTHWNDPNTGATNESGFTALPGGYRSFNGDFNSQGISTYYWSFTEYNSSSAWSRTLSYDHQEAQRGYNDKHHGFSIRCVKNSEVNPDTTLYIVKIDGSGDFTVIQTAINVTTDGDTVLVHPGTYVENINFNGKNIVVGSLYLTTQDTSYISSTIIDGNQNGSVVTFESGEDSISLLIGFSITNGLGSGTGWSDFYGGGITCRNASIPKLKNLYITGNTAQIGGGIYCYNSSPIIINSNIINNTTSERGGCGYLFNSSPTFRNVLIAGNTANGEGGGIFCRTNSNPNLINVTFSDNVVAVGEGGSIFCEDNSNPIIINSVLYNNSPQEICFSGPNASNSITISYSNVENGEVGILTHSNGIVNWLDGNVTTNPLFSDADHNDYSLTDYSPCIGAGSASVQISGTWYYAPATDIEGNPRPNPTGSNPDMGAYENSNSNPTNVKITEIYPRSGIPGTSVIIYGTGFNSTPTENQVEFAGVPASILSSSFNQIETIVPSTVPTIAIVTISIGALQDTSSIPFTILSQSNRITSFLPEQIISTEMDQAYCIYSDDLDRDGDMDVLSASYWDNKIAWYENLGNGVFGEQRIISTEAQLARHLYTADLDNDGDNDVLSASYLDDKIAWYENLGTEISSSQQVITLQADGAWSVHASDLNNDGYIDVLSASFIDNKIAWYENNGDGTFGSQQIITTLADSAYSVYAADLDGDGDQDVLSASANDKIAWYENLGDETFSPQHIITNSVDFPTSVHAADLDNDGDLDVLSSSALDDKVAWYSNNGDGLFSEQPIISDSADGAYTVTAGDLNGDGFLDILSASQNDDKIAWYKNLGIQEFGTEIIVSNTADGARTVHYADLDNDGDLDILSASMDDNKIAWYENVQLTTIHVSITGSDDNEGSEENPFATIQHGINQSANGDTILVEPGEYTENLYIGSGGIHIASTFILTGDTTQISNTIINGGANGSVIIIDETGVNPVKFTGFVVKNGWNSEGAGIHVMNNSTAVFDHLRISENQSFSAGAGFVASNYSTCFFDSCEIINNNSSTDGAGLWIQSNSTAHISRSIIAYNSAGGNGGAFKIQDQASLRLNNVTIGPNEALGYGNGSDTPYFGCAFYLDQADDIEITNSILFNLTDPIFFVGGTSDTINVSYSNFCEKDTIIDADTDQTYSLIIDNGNINTNPGFSDYLSGDLTLLPLSQCIDAGDPDLDNDGTTWETDPDDQDPDGTRMDMGAYYYHQTAGYSGPIWHISTTGSDPTGDGSESNPFASIQKGIDATINGNTVLVSPGLYYENITFGNNNILLLSIEGRDSTIIDGLNNGRVIEGFGSSIDSSTVINGFTIQNGHTDVSGNGGGIYIFNASPKFTNCIIKNNTSYSGGWGGGIYAQLSSMIIDSCFLTGNDGLEGTAVCFNNCESIQILNSSFYSNSGNAASLGFLNDYSGHHKIKNCSFYNEEWFIEIESALDDSITIINSSFSESTYRAMQFGHLAYLHIQNCIFEDIINSSGGPGAAINAYSDYMLIEKTIFNNCWAQSNKGAILYADGNQVIFDQNIIINCPNPGYGETEALLYMDNIADIQITSSILWCEDINQWDSYYRSYTGHPTNVDVSYSNVNVDLPMGVGLLGNIRSNPFFCDIYNTDLTVAANSPLLGAGQNGENIGNTIVGCDSTNIGPIWYISQQGSDSTGSGAQNNPFKTFQVTNNSYALENDTIILLEGVYTENLILYNKALTVGSLFVIDEENSHIANTIIDAQGSNHPFEIDLFLTEELVTVEGLTITGGQHYYGGGIYISNGFVKVSNCIINNCNATRGGGIYGTDADSLIVEYCTFYNNEATHGGGLLVNNGIIYVNHCTFYNNHSTYPDGNDMGFDGPASIVSIENTIAWSNLYTNELSYNSGVGMEISLNYSDIGNLLSPLISSINGTGNIEQYPMFVDTSYYNLNLLWGSPCIDAGNPNSSLDPDSTRADMGAFYYDQTDTIPPVIIITSPTIVSQFGTEDTLSVEWTAEDSRFLSWAKIYFSYGDSYPFEFLDSLEASAEYFEWPVPDSAVSTECRVKIEISDHRDNITADTSDYFTIYDNTPPDITVLSPQMGFSIPEYESITVTWNATDNIATDSVDAHVSNDGGIVFQYVSSAVADSGQLSFTMPVGVTDSAQIKIILQDLYGNVNEDFSDYFTVSDNTPPSVTITSPGPGSYGTEDVISIEWTASDNTSLSTTKIFHSPNVEASYDLIDSIDANIVTYDWPVPDSLISSENRILIIVSDLSGNFSADTSDYFAIYDNTPPIVDIIAPDEGFSILEHEYLNIEWVASDNGLIDLFEVNYYDINGIWGTSGVPISGDSTSTGIWITAGVFDSARVMITAVDTSGNSGQDISHYFSVTDNTPPTISLLTPTAGEELGIGSGLKITWLAEDNVFVSGVDLYYSTNNGSSWSTISESEINDGTYDWMIPNEPSNQVGLRLVAEDAVSLKDTVEVMGLSINIEYPTVINITPDPSESLSWLGRDSGALIQFSQPILDPIDKDSVIITCASGLVLEPYFTNIVADSILWLWILDGFPTSDTISIELKSRGFTNIYSYELDGNGDGVPGDDYKIDFTTTMLADYDTSNTIDVIDLAQFIQALGEDNYYYELGPVKGTAPNFTTYTDSAFNIEDVMAFVMIWNWYVTTSGPSFQTYADAGTPLTVETTIDSIIIDVPDGALVYEIQIKYDPVTLMIGDLKSSSDIRLSNLNEEDGIYRFMTGATVEDRLCVPISILGKKTNLEISFRAAGYDSQIISKMTKEIQIVNIPTEFALHQNFPNPFNPLTTIEYDLPEDGYVNLVIYNILGRQVTQLTNEFQEAGYKSIIWNGRNSSDQIVSAGMYFYAIEAGKYSAIRKMILLK